MRLASSALLIAGLVVLSTPHTSLAQNSYAETDLVSDIQGRAGRTDANLANPWGIVPGPTGVFWVADQVTGKSTLYQPDGTLVPLVVTIPGGNPTGIALANATDLRFEFASGDTTAAAIFIFVNLGGSISAWRNTVDLDDAIQVVSTANAVYTGVALASTGSGGRLYAANFASGAIDVFDNHFQPISLASGAFHDPNLPTGYAPFNVANINGQLYVAYAQQGQGEAVSGPGLGFISVFDVDGTLVRRFTSNGPLNAPWAMVVAPAGFGQFGGALLVGNEGEGRINAFGLAGGDLLGTLHNQNGEPIVLEELWGLAFGSAASGSEVAGRLYFAAGIEEETHGLFGYLTPASAGPPPGVSCNESKGFGFWKQLCGGPHGAGQDGESERGLRSVLSNWAENHRKGKVKSNNGHGHGHPGLSADSLNALMACVDSKSHVFGDGGCFTASCELLQRHGSMPARDRLAQRFLVLLANSCAGLICDAQALTCATEDDGDDEGEDGEHVADLIRDNDLHTVGDVIGFVDARICGDGGTEASVSELQELVACALSSGREDDGEDEGDDAGDDDGQGGDITSSITHGRIEVKPLGGNPIRMASGIQARLQVSSEPVSVVRLGIYDAAGRLVARLLRDVAVGAPVEVRWDGRDLRGERVPPGTYFYRASGANSVAGGRIVVLH